METVRRSLAAAPDGWTLGSLVLAAVLLMPIVAVGWMALFPTENIWPHLVRYALPVYLGNTLMLMAMVGFGTACIGTGAAWLVVMTDFPGRRVLEWALLAPLAMPAYIGAYALVDLLEYAGPVQTALRHLFGWQDARDYWFPQIRSIWSAGFVLTLSLYPYVYLLARAAFREQSVCALEVGRSLGCGPWGVFLRLGLPLARPAVVAGSAIAMMETLNDFGAVDYFNVPTLTRGVFAIWLDTYNAGGAAQISLVMLGFVLLLLALERVSRRGKRFHHTSRRYRPIRRARPKRLKRAVVIGLCCFPVLFGFVLPTLIVAWHAGNHLGQWAESGFWRAMVHTGVLAGLAAAISCAVGIFMVYGATGLAPRGGALAGAGDRTRLRGAGRGAGGGRADSARRARPPDRRLRRGPAGVECRADPDRLGGGGGVRLCGPLLGHRPRRHRRRLRPGDAVDGVRRPHPRREPQRRAGAGAPAADQGLGADRGAADLRRTR